MGTIPMGWISHGFQVLNFPTRWDILVVSWHWPSSPLYLASLSFSALLTIMKPPLWNAWCYICVLYYFLCVDIEKDAFQLSLQWDEQWELNLPGRMGAEVVHILVGTSLHPLLREWSCEILATKIPCLIGIKKSLETHLPQKENWLRNKFCHMKLWKLQG